MTLGDAQEGKPEVAQNPRALQPGAPHAEGRILVVDDEPLILTSAREILAREGYRVDTTENPLEALKFLQQNQYAVIFSDQRMPSMLGLELLAQAQKLQPDAARVLITGVI